MLRERPDGSRYAQFYWKMKLDKAIELPNS
jgi:hypothetical protein